MFNVKTVKIKFKSGLKNFESVNKISEKIRKKRGLNKRGLKTPFFSVYFLIRLKMYSEAAMAEIKAMAATGNSGIGMWLNSRPSKL